MDNNNSSLEYTTIKNSSVVDSVKDWIIDQLIKGNLRPGSKLPTEAELCANMGASRNSVREAIKQLEAYGVIYIKRAEGTFVTDSYEPRMLSPILYSLILQNNHWSDFVDLRRAIDIGTLYVLMAKHPDGEQLEKLRCALHALEETVSCDKLDVVRITEADCNFHNVVITLANNPQLKTLSEFINRITVPSREKTTETVIASGEIVSYIRLHRQMYSVIEQGDKSGIERAVLDHYVFWERYSD
ncbi:MAG: GntR family transcriptional regulator [Oscillospiraceae bacterium]|nr:GntR family transcriptional regulator [Oscillospiraceae bacterium]